MKIHFVFEDPSDAKSKGPFIQHDLGTPIPAIGDHIMVEGNPKKIKNRVFTFKTEFIIVNFVFE